MKSIGLVVTGFLFVLLLAGKTLAEPKLPITKSQGPDPIGGIGYMQTNITIARNGNGAGALSAVTHTWSEKDLEGFHGSVAVAALDRNQRLLWVSATQTYGVDGKRCFGNCHSNRTDSWGDTIPAQVLSQTAYIAIKQRYTPKGINLDDIGSFLRGLGNNVSRELASIVQDVETVVGAVPPTPPPQGSVASNAHRVVDPGADEPCLGPFPLNPQSPGGLLPTDYHLPPARFLSDPRGLEESDGRLNPILRSNAQTRDAHKILANAMRTYLVGEPSGVSPLRRPDPELALALAELAVTGSGAFNSFKAWHPQDSDLVQYVRQTNAGQNFDPQALQNAAHKLLDVAYTTLWSIRANDATWRQYRQRLGWIAVSGEDDLPHRPVNIRTAHYPQYNAHFVIPGTAHPIPVETRYMVASANTSLVLPAGVNTTPPTPRSIPSDGRPEIPRENKIIIYIHGGGSRLEEAVPLAEKLIAAGARRGLGLTVIALDMPNSGLSSRFDHTLVADSGPGEALGSYHPPQGDRGKPIPNPPLTYGYPIMDTEEQYVLNFLDAIDKDIGDVKNRIIAVMGGSLGGNMSFRLARLAQQYPYFRKVVSWSVTCMQGAEDDNIVGHIGGLIGQYKEDESTLTRHEFFDNLYNKPLISPVLATAIGAGSGAAAGGLVTGALAVAGGAAGGIVGASAALPPQPQLWYRDGWSCKASTIEQTKFDRYEYYTWEFRRWTIRLNYEMTIYSFQDGDLYAPNKAQGPSRYLTVDAKMLLASGEKDEHGPLYTLYSSTVGVAEKMRNTTGTTLFLKNTGHSIHDERPGFFADQIVTFLSTP